MRMAVVIFLSILSTVASANDALTPDEQENLNRGLRQAAIAGLIPGMERLIKEGAEINAKAPYGETALEYAVRFGRYKAAQRLLELGADPNTEDDSGRTALYTAMGSCNASHVVEALLKAGAKVNHKDGYGRTALMSGAYEDCIRNVAILLSRKKDEIEVDAQDDAFETASDLARQGVILQMMESLREYRDARGTEPSAGVRPR